MLLPSPGAGAGRWGTASRSLTAGAVPGREARPAPFDAETDAIDCIADVRTLVCVSRAWASFAARTGLRAAIAARARSAASENRELTRATGLVLVRAGVVVKERARVALPDIPGWRIRCCSIRAVNCCNRGSTRTGTSSVRFQALAWPCSLRRQSPTRWLRNFSSPRSCPSSR